MKTKLVLLLVLISPLSGFGEIPTPGQDLNTYCLSPTPGDPAPIDIVLAKFKVDDVLGVGVIRRTMAAQIAKDYVKPAMAEGCRNRVRDGGEFVKRVQSACNEGCDRRINDWPLEGQVREDQIVVCKADCRAGAHALAFLAGGIDLGRLSKQ